MALAMTLETYKNWNIQSLDEDYILAQSNHDLEDQILTFVMKKERCDRVVQLFEIFTMTNHPELELLIDKELQLRENGSPATGEVIDIIDHKGGHIVLVSMGHYKQKSIRDYYTFHKRFRVTVTKHPLGENISLMNLFDLPTHEWTVEDIKGVMDRAEYHCHQISNPMKTLVLLYTQKGPKI